jgi:hypothetical protein
MNQRLNKHPQWFKWIEQFSESDKEIALSCFEYWLTYIKPLKGISVDFSNSPTNMKMILYYLYGYDLLIKMRELIKTTKNHCIPIPTNAENLSLRMGMAMLPFSYYKEYLAAFLKYNRAENFIPHIFINHVLYDQNHKNAHHFNGVMNCALFL